MSTNTKRLEKHIEFLPDLTEELDILLDRFTQSQVDELCALLTKVEKVTIKATKRNPIGAWIEGHNITHGDHYTEASALFRQYQAETKDNSYTLATFCKALRSLGLPTKRISIRGIRKRYVKINIKVLDNNSDN